MEVSEWEALKSPQEKADEIRRLTVRSRDTMSWTRARKNAPLDDIKAVLKGAFVAGARKSE